MAELKSTLSVFLNDRFSGPSRGISGAIGRLSRQTRQFGARHAGFGATAFGSVRNLALVGAGYLGVSNAFEATFGNAKTLQAALTEIGLKGELTSVQLSALDRQTRQLGKTTNQTQADLLSGVDAMLGAGIAGDVARDSIGIIGRTATATGASIADLSSTTAALVQNLKVTPDGLKQALEAMTQAGNDGAFEVRDMAQAFPALTASARTLGMEGPRAVAELSAWLQIARRGAGDSSTAANNLSNTLQKMVTPQTIKNFKKFGVDITKVLAEAKKKGLSPIEAFIKTVDKATDGGKADLLGQLFGDKQVLDFLRPALADYEDFVRLRERADRAGGIIDRQYAERMENAVERLKSAQVAMQNRLTPVGTRMLEPIANFAENFAGALNTLDERASVFDRLSSGVSGFINGLGFKDGTLSSALNEGFDLVFGKLEGAQQAGERLGRIFDRFQAWGQATRSFASDIGGFVNSVEKFAGLDTGSFGRFLASLGGYGFTLAIASVGISMTAKAIWGLARAVAFLTGVSAAWSIGKGVFGFGKDLLGTGAKEAAKAAPKGAPPAAPVAASGWLARLSSFLLPLFLSSDSNSNAYLDASPEERARMRKEAGEAARRMNGEAARKPPNKFQDGSYLEELRGIMNGVDAFKGMRPSTMPPAAANDDKVSILGKPTVITEPSGVQRVQVINPGPAPVINMTVNVTASTNANPEEIANQVARITSQHIREAMAGAQADVEYSVA